MLVHFPMGTLLGDPYPIIKGYIMDAEHSTLLVRLYINKAYCKLLSKTDCKKIHHYDTMKACHKYLCMNFLTVRTMSPTPTKDFKGKTRWEYGTFSCSNDSMGFLSCHGLFKLQVYQIVKFNANKCILKQNHLSAQSEITTTRIINIHINIKPSCAFFGYYFILKLERTFFGHYSVFMVLSRILNSKVKITTLHYILFLDFQGND